MSNDQEFPVYNAQELDDDYGRDFFRMSQAEVAAALGVTKTAVRKAEVRGMRKLRAWVQQAQLKKEDWL